MNDLRFAAIVHKDYHRDAGVLTVETAFEMATIRAARAVGRADELGTLEVGKKADLVLLDLDYSHLTPTPTGKVAIAAVVY